jgi:transcriptional regulator with XRE-family HTH domain
MDDAAKSEADLRALGRALRERRKAVGTPRAEFARRLGVSPTYVWMVEQTKPRASGAPSRPSRSLLHRWSETLLMSDQDRGYLLTLAGYAREEDAASQEHSRKRALSDASRAGAHSLPRDLEALHLAEKFRQVMQDAADTDVATWDEVAPTARSIIGLLRLRVDTWQERTGVENRHGVSGHK